MQKIMQNSLLHELSDHKRMHKAKKTDKTC